MEVKRDGEIIHPPSNGEAGGIRCPGCGCAHFWVVYTNRAEDRIIRRRECRHCGRRVTTREQIITKKK